MAHIHVLGTWTGGSITYGKRDGQSFGQWAAAAVEETLAGGPGTLPASGSGDPLTHEIIWTKDSVEYVYNVEVWGTQQELDDAVAALKAAIAAAGGTVVSG